MRNIENSIPSNEIDPPAKKINRRDFLKTLGMGLSALIVTSAMPGPLSPSEKTPTKTTQSEKKELPRDPLREKMLQRVNCEIEKIITSNNYQDLVGICKNIERYSDNINKYSTKYSINPCCLKGLIFVESKGDPEAYNDLTGATGLCQFTSNTAKEFNLTDRKDPISSIAATAKFISYYRQFLGTEDLAVASFHMGYGNMCDLISSFVKPKKYKNFPKEIVIPEKLNYLKIYFDSDPLIKPETHKLLFNELDDDSANYYFKILAANAVLDIANKNPDKLKSLYNI